MVSKFIILVILLIVDEILAQGGNNNTLSNDHLKTKFGCIPLEKWNSMRWENDAIEVACMSKDYKVEDEPKEIARNPIFILIVDSTIVDIDEKKKRMTVEIGLVGFWQDERIKAVFAKKFRIMEMPPVTREENTVIWNPFRRLVIRNLKKRTYILDPIIAKMGLASSKPVDGISFLWNRSIVWSKIEWRVTVSCPFDFVNFPFDAHTCPFKMVLPFDGNLTVYNEKRHTINYNDGFDINTHQIDPVSGQVPFLKSPYTIFGFDVNVKRHLSPYVFQYYLPAITIVIASSVSFIIPLSAIPGRVALAVTQFLTLTNIFIHQMVYTLGLSSYQISFLYFYRHRLCIPYNVISFFYF